MKVILYFTSLVAATLVLGAGGGPVPNPGITQARAPLARSGSTVYLTTNGTIRASHLYATTGTFGIITVNSCVGCSSGGSGSGGTGTGSSTVSLARLGPMLADWRANSGVFSDTGCSVVVNTGGTIGCWHDLTGHGNDVVQASGSAQPVWYPNDNAGMPGVYFIGAQVLAAASPSHRTGAGVSSCVVVRPAVTSGQASVVGDWDNGAAKGWLTGFSSNASSFEGIRSVIFHGSGLDLHQNVMPALTVHSFCTTFDGTTDTIYYDGAAVGAGAATLSFGTSTYLVGATTTALAEPFLGDVYEAFVYDTGLTPALVGSADLYARQYWGSNNYATAVSGGSGGSGGTVSDPITVNGWAPASGTGTVTGNETVTGTLSGEGNGSVFGSFDVGHLTASTLTSINSTYSGQSTFNGGSTFNGKVQIGTGNRGTCTTTGSLIFECTVGVSSGLSACQCSYNSAGVPPSRPCEVSLSGSTATASGAASGLGINVLCY